MEPGTPVFWLWWAAAVALLIAEVFAPGLVFIWLACGAFVAGLAVLAAPDLSLPFVLLIFAAGSGLSLLVGRPLLRRAPAPADEPHLNARALSLVGRGGILVEPLVDGVGRARLGDTTWAVVGPDLPAGAHVVVIGVDGTRLRVEPRG